MKLLFEQIAVPMARPGTPGAWYAGLRMMAIDGLVLDMPDTATSPSPQVRLVALGECGTHAVVDATLGNRDSAVSSGVEIGAG